MSDFDKTSKNTYTSKCKKYKLIVDGQRYYYPCVLYYELLPHDHQHQFYCHPVHVGYDYSFSFEDALEVLNMVIADTWQYGRGRYINGIQKDSTQQQANKFKTQILEDEI